MGKHTFNGTKPVACLRFLSIFKIQLDNEGVPEAGALKVLPEFLSGDALDVFNGMTEDDDAELSCFITWSEDLQLFLHTYAKDQYHEDEVNNSTTSLKAKAMHHGVLLQADDICQGPRWSVLPERIHDTVPERFYAVPTAFAKAVSKRFHGTQRADRLRRIRNGN